jgi:hypothetical protein
VRRAIGSDRVDPIVDQVTHTFLDVVPDDPHGVEPLACRVLDVPILDRRRNVRA